MSLKKLEIALRNGRLHETERKWFLVWLQRFARFHRLDDRQPLPVEREPLIAFLKVLRDRGRPAWQRLQVVRALEFYQMAVLRRNESPLQDVRLRLVELARAERDPQMEIVDQQRLVGHIDPNEPETVQQLRRELRLRHYSPRTEKAYVGWTRRFLNAHSINTPDSLAEVGEAEIKEFLSELAVEGHVSASTQNQAFSALLFLFQKVLQRELEFVDAVRAKKPRRLPVRTWRKALGKSGSRMPWSANSLTPTANSPGSSFSPRRGSDWTAAIAWFEGTTWYYIV